MVGQCAHRRYPFGRCSIRGAAVRDLGLAFELFQGKLELFDLERELLRRLAEGHAAKLGELVTEGVDQRIAGRSEEHTSELQSLMRISYAVFCLKKKKKHIT